MKSGAPDQKISQAPGTPDALFEWENQQNITRALPKAWDLKSSSGSSSAIFFLFGWMCFSPSDQLQTRDQDGALRF